MRAGGRLWGLMAVLLLLGGCALDREEDLRDSLSDWLKLAQTRHFFSKPTCTVAIFDLASDQPRKGRGPIRGVTYKQALFLIERGHSILFDMPGVSPNKISEQIMSRNLEMGLGVLSSGIGPVLRCMEDEGIQKGVYRILVSPEARLAYLTEGNALLLIYPPEMLAVFLRGNV